MLRRDVRRLVGLIGNRDECAILLRTELLIGATTRPGEDLDVLVAVALDRLPEHHRAQARSILSDCRNEGRVLIRTFPGAHVTAVNGKPVL